MGVKEFFMNFALLENQEGIVRAILLLFLKKKGLYVQSSFFFRKRRNCACNLAIFFEKEGIAREILLLFLLYAIFNLSKIIHNDIRASLHKTLACSVAVSHADGHASGIASHENVEMSVAHNHGILRFQAVML